MNSPMEAQRDELLALLHEVQARVISRTLPIKMSDALAIVRPIVEARRDTLERQEKVRLMGTLTPREAEVVGHLIKGLTNKEIAAEMFVSVQAVKFHTTNIYRKVGVSNRTSLARISFEHDAYMRATEVEVVA